jgi:hypothetical protein
MRRREPWINRQWNRRSGTDRKGGRRKTAEVRQAICYRSVGTCRVCPSGRMGGRGVGLG